MAFWIINMWQNTFFVEWDDILWVVHFKILKAGQQILGLTVFSCGRLCQTCRNKVQACWQWIMAITLFLKKLNL